MNQAELQSAGIAYAEGAARFCGKADLYEKFLRRFPSEPSFEALKKALSAGDSEAAFRAAHTLKGVAGNLSLHALWQALLPIVEALRDGRDLPHAQQLFPALQAVYDKTVQLIIHQG